MYTSLESNTWKTSLFKCDCESCFVSYIAPCHVYAKLRNSNYAYYCFVYASLWVFMQTVYSCIYFVEVNLCPTNQVNYCFGLNEFNCSQSYMIVDNIPSSCSYHYDANVCIYGKEECITYYTYNHTQPMLMMFLMVGYLSLCFLHFNLRNQIKEQHKIDEDSTACCANTCCSTCGLAQMYREV